MAAITICSDFGAPQNKVSHCFPIYLPWSNGTDAMILVFWMLSFKPTFSLSSLTFIKRLFAAAAKSLQLCLTLCDPIDGSPPGSPVPGILQARTPEWVAMSFSNAWKWKVKVKMKSCLTLSDRMDCSLPGSSAHGIFQAKVLEWDDIMYKMS